MNSAGISKLTTVTAHVATASEHLAEMVASPIEMAVIRPFWSTVAISGSEDVHSMVLSSKFHGLTVAVTFAVVVSRSVMFVVEISTVAFVEDDSLSSVISGAQPEIRAEQKTPASRLKIDLIIICLNIPVFLFLPV